MKLHLLLVLSIALTGCSAGSKLAKENIEDLSFAEKVTEDFSKRLGEGAFGKSSPELRFQSSSSEAVYYDSKKNRVFLTPYGELENHQSFYQEWSSELENFQDGESLYESLLYHWMLPHQIAYAFQERVGPLPERPWDAEMNANMLSWLFLKEMNFYQLEEGDIIEAMEAIRKKTEQQLKAEGVDLHALQENYAMINTIQRYWYLQSSNFLTAYRVSRAISLEKMIKAIRRRAK
jgi:hypothetical protein